MALAVALELYLADTGLDMIQFLRCNLWRFTEPGFLLRCRLHRFYPDYPWPFTEISFLLCC